MSSEKALSSPVLRAYKTALYSNSHRLVIATGPAGCGKTYHACERAISGLRTMEFAKLVVTRPAVSVDGENHGFLPGDMNEKIRPWMLPVMDNLLQHSSRYELEQFVRNDRIEFASLGFMRGSTIRNSIVLADEMQNASVLQMKMLLTRPDDATKIIITGDEDQSDRDCNGLSDLTERIMTEEEECMLESMVSMIRFEESDTLRSDMVRMILKIYNS